MEYGVVIVGAGFAGLGMAMTLKRAGRDDFVILEKAEALGGTWWENTYPGCGCDIASHLYSFSFAPRSDWSRAYAEQPEILGYLKQTAERFDVVRHIRFNTELVDARFDESTDRWVVTAADGSTYLGWALVLGVGALNRPTYPDLPGLPSFTGPTFHSARWNHDIDLTGKRVAVIGTGASAIQFVPRIAPQVAQLHVFQRAAPWLLPRPDHPFGPRAKRVFATVPPARWAYRSALYWRNEIAAAGFTMSPKLMRAVAVMSRRHLRKQVADPALRAKLTPSYTIGCKRILIASDYYPALTRRNVELVTEPIIEVGPQWIVTDDGTKRDVDVIIFGTGFRVVDKLAQLPVTGPGGVTLARAWRGGVEAYLGMTVAGFGEPVHPVRAEHRSGPQLRGLHDRGAAAVRDALPGPARGGATHLGRPGRAAPVQRSPAAEDAAHRVAGRRLPQLVPRRRRGEPGAVVGLVGRVLATDPPPPPRPLHP